MSYPPQPELFIRPHLGLGDALIINALVRHFAQGQRVVIPAKHHNMASVVFMFRDQPNIRVVPVKDDAEADALRDKSKFSLGLGMFGSGFTFEQWDACMYKQAGLSFKKRWTDFYYRREPSSEIQPPHKGEFAFIHEDSEREMTIDDDKLPGLPLILAEKQSTIFAYTRIIEEAQEIHIIDSAFLSLIESIPTRANRLVLHLYARPDAKPPTLRKNWLILT